MDISSAAQHQLHHHYNHHHQEIRCESDSQGLSSNNQQQQQQQEKKARPAETEAQKCPRCDSINTKFCYYNNYSLTQPRYFCKNCRRYWTKGGTLRNVPVGGGCRKNNKRCPSPSSPATFSSSAFLKRPHNVNTQDMMTSAAAAAPAGLSHLLSAGLHLPYGGFGGFDVSGSGNLTVDCDGILGHHQHSGGFFNSLGINLQNPPCYDQFGIRNENNAAGMIGEEMPYDCGAAVKQESNEGRAFLGFPWPMGGDYGSISLGAGDLEPYRESWNAGQVGNFAVQGLINSAALI